MYGGATPEQVFVTVAVAGLVAGPLCFSVFGL